MKISKVFQFNNPESHPIRQKKWTADQILRRASTRKVKGGKGDIIIIDKDVS